MAKPKQKLIYLTQTQQNVRTMRRALEHGVFDPPDADLLPDEWRYLYEHLTEVERYQARVDRILARARAGDPVALEVLSAPYEPWERPIPWDPKIPCESS
jgi:hypothetical protein